MSSRIAIGLACTIVAASSAAAQIVRYVDDSAPPDGDGLTWATAHDDLQDALDAAQSGDEIRVAGGVYRPSRRTEPTTTRTETFQLVTGVEIRGGYAGLAVPGSPDTRNIALYESILTGAIGAEGDYALDFDGTDQYVNLGSPAELTELGQGDFTIEAWVRTTDTGRSILIGNYDGTPFWNLEIHNSAPAGRVRLVFSDGITWEDHLTDFSIADGQWHHIAGVRTLGPDGNALIYVDGDLAYTSSAEATGFSVPRSTMIGRDPRASSHHLDGMLDEVRVWDFARDGNDIADDMYTALDGTETGLVGYWRFEEGTDLAAFDSAGTDDGTLIGPPVWTLTNTDNKHHVVTGSGTDYTAVLDGFTIARGNAETLQHYGGGGMINNYGSPTLLNCAFRNNSAQFGGGIYDANSDPTLQKCRFSHNSASNEGGGMFNYESSPTLTDCTFDVNSAYLGGGLHIEDNSSPTLTNCTFSGNSATWEGGGMRADGGTATLVDCTFNGNSAFFGGGLYNTSGLTITSSTLSQNTAETGAGMYNYYCSPVVTGCFFEENAAMDGGGGVFNYLYFDTCRGTTLTDRPSTGGRADNGGARYDLDPRPSLTNCTFSKNSADDGGAMYNKYGSPRVDNCAFSGNRAATGGGMFNDHAGPIVTNCTFCGSWGAYCSGIANLYGSYPVVTNCVIWIGTALAGPQIFEDGTSTSSITHSCIRDGWPGTGNFDADPLFVDPGYWDDNGTPEYPFDDTWVDGDHRLLPGSPCINTGDPAFVPEPPETDMDGHYRALCARVDMGAYEFGIGDYDCDQDVDLDDFGSWETCVTGPDNGPYNPGCEALDFEYDGDVDLSDFAPFQRVLAPRP